MFYCSQCCRSLLPKAEADEASTAADDLTEDVKPANEPPQTYPLLALPAPNAPPPQRLPFEVDVILHDDRDVATGVQLAVLSSNANVHQFDPSPTSSAKPTKAAETSPALAATAANNAIPDYASSPDFSTTYVLFPGPSAIPVSQVAGKITRLVALDCKWTKTISATHPSVACLQQVTLSDPPDVSLFWRWHGKGTGMLSTIEAVFVAAWEVNEARSAAAASEGAEHTTADALGGAGAAARNLQPNQGDPTGLLKGVFTLFGLQKRALEKAGNKEKMIGGLEGGNGAGFLPWEEGFKSQKRAERAQAGSERQKQQKIASREKPVALRRKEDSRNN